ncbi:MAG: RNA methyltransferase [Tidjanibacter sp.]|nr:RNA methyltransferase [Tidjanibacter sp.]
MQKLTQQQMGRKSAEEFAAMEKLPVVAVLDNVRSAGNVGAFFRTSDAFGVGGVVLCGITATPPQKEIHKTALGAELTVEWSHYPTTLAAVEALKAEGYEVWAVEQVEGSVSLGDFAPECGKNYALVFGNEVDGVAQEVVDVCAGAIEIPQVGTKHSLNVAVTGGVVLWEMFRKLNCNG